MISRLKGDGWDDASSIASEQCESQAGESESCGNKESAIDAPITPAEIHQVHLAVFLNEYSLKYRYRPHRDLPWLYFLVHGTIDIEVGCGIRLGITHPPCIEPAHLYGSCISTIHGDSSNRRHSSS